MANAGKALVAVGKGVVVLVGTLIATELIYNGSQAAATDIEILGKGVKYLVKPTPVTIKKGFKKKVVKVNPFTGEIKPFK